MGGRHPGPVDNSPLKGSLADELRRDLVVDRDYVLLPQESADLLFQLYSGGPTFPRKVKCADAFNGRSMEVDLWPVRVSLYLCDHSYPTPDPEGPFSQRRFFPSGMTLREAVTLVERRLFHFDINTPTRCWLRETPPNPVATAAGMGRRRTNDKVEWDGGWHLIGSAMGCRLKDIRGDGDCIELIVEVASCRDPKPSDWPRFHLLEAWNERIRMGDLIDARAAQGHCKAAAGIHENEVGDLVVRNRTENERIGASDVDCRIAPLHSHSAATSAPTVDTTARSTQVTQRASDKPRATSDEGGSANEDDPGASQVAKLQSLEGHRGGVEPPCSGSGVVGCSGSDSGSGIKASPLATNDANAPTEAAPIALSTHLRRALHAYGISTPRVDTMLQVLRDEEVSSLAVWQALTPFELSSLLEAHRETLPLGLRTAMRLVHGAARTP